MEAPDLPDFLKRNGPYIRSNSNEGMASLTFFEVENSKLADGLGAISKYMSHFYGIPGLKYESMPYFHVEEALQNIGMGQ